MRKQLTEDEIQNIIYKYNIEFLSTIEISKIFNRSAQCINNVLRTKLNSLIIKKI